MGKDVFDFSFDEIVNDSTDEKNIRLERVIEIKRYERLYLLKSHDENKLPLSDIADEKRFEIFENILFNGFRRIYVEDLTERDYRLEGCTPFQIEISGVIVEDSSWGDFLCKVVLRLFDIYPEKKINIDNFRCDWTKAVMFSLSKKTNYKKLYDDLYLNCNHTALHSCWLLQDILDYFQIDKGKVRLLIHRPCIAERRETRDYIETEFKRGFKYYLCSFYEKSEEYSDKVISNIDTFLNPILNKISNSYPNIFLFDDAYILSNYIKKIREFVLQSVKYDEKAKKILCKYLNYLFEFYRL